MEKKVITDEEIVECGWEPTEVLIDGDYLDDQYTHDTTEAPEGDVFMKGWQFRKDKDTWWEMCRNSRRLLIVKKWYVNEVGQEWDVVLDCPIIYPEELLNEMSYLNIKRDKDGK